MTTKRRYGRVLTPQQAVEIFSYKLTSPVASYATVHLKHGNDHSGMIGKIYNVSAKTIRDIWNRRSWRHETFHLWHLSKDKNCLPDQSVDYAQIVTQSTDCKPSAILPNAHTPQNFQHQETLPASSSNEDPFHDDWPYWNMSRDAECQIADFVFL